MRHLLLALCLAGCGAMGAERDAQPKVTGLFLAPGYLQPKSSPLRIDFDRAVEGVIPSVSRLLRDDPQTRQALSDCGAGPVTAVAWPGLTLNFTDGALQGWVADTPRFETLTGLRVGLTRSEVQALGVAEFQQTSLGTEFSDGDLFGLMTDGRVALLWSGVTCFFR